MINKINFKLDVQSITNNLKKNKNKKVLISQIISEIKKIYPIHKDTIRSYFNKIFKIKLQKNQKNIYIKSQNKKCDNYEIYFVIIEGLYFLLEKKIKVVNKYNLYNFFIKNNQLLITYNQFEIILNELAIYKKYIFINRKTINKLICEHNINQKYLYNKTYLLDYLYEL